MVIWEHEGNVENTSRRRVFSTFRLECFLFAFTHYIFQQVIINSFNEETEGQLDRFFIYSTFQTVFLGMKSILYVF